VRFSRDSWLAIAILLTLVLVVTASVVQKTNDIEIPYVSTSPAPNGTLALKLWLNGLGYDATETTPSEFRPDENVRTIFILQPITVISDAEWDRLDKWVDAGGVLVMAGDNGQTNMALDHFGFSISYLQAQATDIFPAAPILVSPALVSGVTAKIDFGLRPSEAGFTPLMVAEDFPVVVAIEQGQGRVILSSAPFIFSNSALKDDATAALVLNLVALTGPRGSVWFDEWHHGFQAEGNVGPWNWLKNTSGGHAILFFVGAIFLALLLQGTTFGRPVPLPHEVKRRGPLEHVTAIANLNRKAGHRDETLKEYHHRLKRHLGQRYHLDPTIEDDEYATQLSQFNSAIDRDELLDLLKGLTKEGVSEAELLKLTIKAARWIDE